MIVADATVLIALAKTQRLQILRLVYDEVLIGQVVSREALDQGKAIAAPGVEQIERAIQDGFLRAVRLTLKEQRLMRRVLGSSRLDEGEAESLVLAKNRKAPLIVDDKAARAMAEILGIEYLGTAGVLLEAFSGGHLSFRELEESVEDLAKVMWISPAVVAAILKSAREGKK